MIANTKKTIKKHHLILPGSRVLVAVSGGPDSVCLIEVLIRLKTDLGINQLAVFHLNHMLRGTESDNDALFVSRLAKKMRLPFFGVSKDVRSIAKKRKLSLEEAARDIRYALLIKIAAENDYTCIAAGHNADDQAETVLMRLLRGSGPRGITGIPIQRRENNITIIRPLLETPREKILLFLKNNNCSYRYDSSNSNDEFTRNNIRKNLIPLLEKDYNPGIKDVLLRFAGMQEALYDFTAQTAGTIFNTIVRKRDNGIILPIQEIVGLPEALLTECIRLAINKIKRDLRNITHRHIQDILELVSSKTGSMVCLPNGLGIYKEYDFLVFTPEKYLFSPFKKTRLTIPGKTIVPGAGIEIEISPVTKAGVLTYKTDSKKPGFRSVCSRIISGESVRITEFLDADRLGKSLFIRSRRDGDRYQPLGAPGTKKIKDIFIDEKIPPALRDFIPVIANSTHIFYLGGYRIAEDARITGTTINAYKLVMTISKREIF